MYGRTCICAYMYGRTCICAYMYGRTCNVTRDMSRVMVGPASGGQTRKRVCCPHVYMNACAYMHIPTMCVCAHVYMRMRIHVSSEILIEEDMCLPKS